MDFVKLEQVYVASLTLSVNKVCMWIPIEIQICVFFPTTC